MIITRKSIISGITRSIDLDITKDQIEKYNNGELVQVAMSNLTSAEREFFITGITDEEWNCTAALE